MRIRDDFWGGMTCTDCCEPVARCRCLTDDPVIKRLRELKAERERQEAERAIERAQEGS